jgi:hypothetical protein
MKVLCIHGVGHQEVSLDWQQAWRDAVAQGLQATRPSLQLNKDTDIQFSNYDDLFDEEVNNLSPAEILRAVALLGGGLFHRALTLPDIADSARWTAGMVIVWVENADVRAKAWQRFRDDVRRVQPDLVCAHSLGTLVSYDAFRQQEDLLQGRTYLTFGCQLGNPCVRGQFGGRIDPFAGAVFWYDLYNTYDHVFTAPLDFGAFNTANNFQQVHTDFGTSWPWPLNHDAVSPDPANAPDKGYLTHPQTSAQVWPRIAVPEAALPVTAGLRAIARKVDRIPDAPRHRALLVGINGYPDPANRLEGCLNDVFLMSAVLQECGFAAADIRVVLDERATAAGILERLHWLLDGTGPDDQRCFFYSGHGAQLPIYGVDGKVERIDACLAPYDFAWSRETAITDDHLVNLYSQLPYTAHFLMVLDSCYSGGLTRGGARVRGLEPPDDIRHRMLRWDAASQMWVPRTLPVANEDLAASPEGRLYVGSSGATRLLGRAVSLRTLSKARCRKVCKDLKHKGPFLPIVFEACGEKELASEYRHGVSSYGAFTYALAASLRRHESAGQSITFAQLLAETGHTLQHLDYDQHPVLVGPGPLVKKAIPWQGPARTGKRKGRARKS